MWLKLLGILEVIISGIAGSLNQVTAPINFYKWESDKRVIRFGKKFDESAKKSGCTRKDALHVYYNGKVTGMVRCRTTITVMKLVFFITSRLKMGESISISSGKLSSPEYFMLPCINTWKYLQRSL